MARGLKLQGHKISFLKTAEFQRDIWTAKMVFSGLINGDSVIILDTLPMHRELYMHIKLALDVTFTPGMYAF